MSESIYDQMAVTVAKVQNLRELLELSHNEIKQHTYGGRDFKGRQDRILTRLRSALEDAWRESHALIRDLNDFTKKEPRTP